ncbi:MAG: hypothetical protein JW827_06065 [Spirochaetes bacterium]|nr:hypothetical protein [Spirochaetota bacterium]
MFTRKKLKKIIIFIFIIVFFTLSEDNLISQSSIWEPLKKIKDISIIVGGDVNGDDLDDRVLLFKKSTNQGMRLLIAEKKGFRTIKYEDLDLDFIKDSDFITAEKINIENNKIKLRLSMDMKRVFPFVESNEDVMLTFFYKGNKIYLEDMVANVSLGYDSHSGKKLDPPLKGVHLWFNVLTSRLYWKTWLKKGKRSKSCYSQFYYRFFAKKFKEIKVDGDKKDWLIIAYPVHLGNFPEGNPIQYGFESWKGDFDLSANIYTGYNDKYFFIYSHVSDDVFKQYLSDKEELEGDHIELWFANSAKEKTRIDIYPGNFTTEKAAAYLLYKGKKSVQKKKIDKIVLATKKMQDGYIIEAKIPVSYLPFNYIGNINSFFTVTLSDIDDSGQEKKLSSSSLNESDYFSLAKIKWE